MNAKHPQYDSVADLYDLAWGDERVPPTSTSILRLLSKSMAPYSKWVQELGESALNSAARGHHVIGLELSPKMAATAILKADNRLEGIQRAFLEIAVGDMCIFDSTTRFGLVILPFTRSGNVAPSNAFRKHSVMLTGCLPILAVSSLTVRITDLVDDNVLLRACTRNGDTLWNRAVHWF